MNNLTKKIEELTEKENLDTLLKLLETADNLRIKEQIADACLDVINFWLVDVSLGKIDRPKELIEDIQRDLGKINQYIPSKKNFYEKAECHSLMADLQEDKNEKVSCIDQEITQYKQWQEADETEPAPLIFEADALVKKQALSNFEEEKNLYEALDLYKTASELDKKYTFDKLIYTNYDIFYSLDYSDKVKTDFHAFFESLADEVAKEYPLTLMDWFGHLLRLEERKELSKEQIRHICDTAEDKLLKLHDYNIHDARTLISMGHSFNSLAKIHENTAKWRNYLLVALDYFTRASGQLPNDWAPTVYATNVLKQMAGSLVQLHDFKKDADIQAEAKKYYGQGQQLFSKTAEKIPEDFGLNLYWADFLYEYARTFENPGLLSEAGKKYEMAKTAGKGFYSQPYMGLAKVALKQNNKTKCLDVLKECKSVFSNEYYTYEFSQIFKDKDFKDIWDDSGFKELTAEK